MKKYFAGIGSRDGLPDNIIELMPKISAYLEACGFTLRSGAANGSDFLFEQGIKSNNNKEIFLPWKGFNRNFQGISDYSEEIWMQAVDIVSDINISPAVNSFLKIEQSKLSKKQKAIISLHTRNVFQILGHDLKTPVKFVVCWTPDGATSQKDYKSGVTGGTGIAINLADKLKIPVFNLQRNDHRLRLETKINNYQPSLGR